MNVLDCWYSIKLLNVQIFKWSSKVSLFVHESGIDNLMSDTAIIIVIIITIIIMYLPSGNVSFTGSPVCFISHFPSTCKHKYMYLWLFIILPSEVDHKHNENCLLSVMSEHKNTITSICWCPEMPDYLASSSVDGTITIWDVVKQLTVAK